MCFEKNLSIFLHCVDSRLEEDGNWYARFHIGPFLPNSRLQIGTRIRRSLLNDFVQTYIIAVELEGAIHEFSRLTGINEPVLDLLFQFRKITFYAPSIKFRKRIIVPFFFSGPGTFYAKDILWPIGIKCKNTKDPLSTLSPGAILKGRFLIQKDCGPNLVKKVGQFVQLSKFFSSKYFNKKFPKYYPWLSLGFSLRSVERSGFRIECIEFSNKKNEVLIFEIFTNGTISPRYALYEATLILTYKFSIIVNVIVTKKRYININQANFRKKFSFFLNKKDVKNQKRFKQTFYSIFDIGFSYFQEPFGIDLENLTLSKARYYEFQNLGFQTLGQLLERLTSDFYSLPYPLEKQRQQAFFRLGIFSLFNFL